MKERASGDLRLSDAPDAGALDEGVECGPQGADLLRRLRGLLQFAEDHDPCLFLSILLGAVTGYALSFWRPKGAGVIFAILIVAAFIPYQVFIYPLFCGLSQVGL